MYINRPALLCIFIIIACWLAFYWPLFCHLNDALSDNDWYQCYIHAEHFRKSILNFRQFAFRNPFLAGGYPSIGHPSDIFLTPLSLPILLFGEVTGTNLVTLLLLLAGTIGMFYLTNKVLKYSYLGSLFSALAFLLCRWGPNAVVNGNFQKLYYNLLPWLAVSLLRSKYNKRYILVSGCLVYLVVVQGGLLVIPLAVFLFLFGLLQSIECKKGYGLGLNLYYLKVLCFTAILSFGISAVKTIPAYQLYNIRTQYIHLPYEDNYEVISGISNKMRLALDLKGVLSVFSHGYEDGDYSRCLSYSLLILSLCGSFIYLKGLWRYLVLLAVFIFIIMGSNAPVDIFKFIWHIHPVAHGIWRLDKYFIFFIVFLVSLIAGKSLDIFHSGYFRMRPKLGAAIAASLVLFCAAEMFSRNNLGVYEVGYRKVSEISHYPEFFQVKLKAIFNKDKDLDFDIDLTSRRAIWDLLRRGIGVVGWSQINWSDNLAIPESTMPKYIIDTIKMIEPNMVEGTAVPLYYADQRLYEAVFRTDQITMPQEWLNPLYRGEVFFLNADNQAGLIYFSPNRIIIEVNVKYSDTLVINQNYHRDWKLASLKPFSYQGLLAVALKDKGCYHLVFRYVPTGFYLGALVSIATILITIALFISGRRG